MRVALPGRASSRCLFVLQRVGFDEVEVGVEVVEQSTRRRTTPTSPSTSIAPASSAASSRAGALSASISFDRVERQA